MDALTPRDRKIFLEALHEIQDPDALLSSEEFTSRRSSRRLAGKQASGVVKLEDSCVQDAAASISSSRRTRHVQDSQHPVARAQSLHAQPPLVTATSESSLPSPLEEPAILSPPLPSRDIVSEESDELTRRCRRGIGSILAPIPLVTATSESFPASLIQESPLVPQQPAPEPVDDGYAEITPCPPYSTKSIATPLPLASENSGYSLTPPLEEYSSIAPPPESEDVLDDGCEDENSRPPKIPKLVLPAVSAVPLLSPKRRTSTRINSITPRVPRTQTRRGRRLIVKPKVQNEKIQMSSSFSDGAEMPTPRKLSSTRKSDRSARGNINGHVSLSSALGQSESSALDGTRMADVVHHENSASQHRFHLRKRIPRPTASAALVFANNDGARYAVVKTPRRRVEASQTLTSRPAKRKRPSTTKLNRELSNEEDQRPNPQGQPTIWADGRQALNETLPWYRAYQSGCYTSNGFAYGFLLDAHCHDRDHIDANVLITRAGGGLSKDKLSNMMIREGDQVENFQTKAIKNNIVHRNPIGFIFGSQNPKSPTKLPHRYNVADWFKPTHVWCEKSGGKSILKYRFEKLQQNEASWWVTDEMAEASKVGILPAPYFEQCHHCQQRSEQVYTVGWMCLKPDCSRFWKMLNDNEPDEAALVYDARFLRQYTPWVNDEEPHSLTPDRPTQESLTVLGEDVSWTAWKGIVCPKCGKCLAREHWRGWICDNSGCDYSYIIPHPLIPVRALGDHYHPLSTGFPISRDRVSAAIEVTVRFTGNYRINSYKVADGIVAHIIPNKAALEESGGPNDMWEELQSKDLGLQRLQLKSNQGQGRVLTQQFGMNYGMPYKFVAATQSASFDDAPDAIRDARTRLNWVSKMVSGQVQPEFNELLALGYFEKQSIDYHDDGESGLGPTIATLSLGYPATMRIRMKDKHSRGLTKTGRFVESEPMPGCVKFGPRKAAWDELQNLKDRDSYRRRLDALPEELGLSLKAQKEGDILEMHLTHGSIVVMSGAKIQQYYEHSVDPLGKLRFALTCRWIDLDSLTPEQRPQYEVTPDDGMYDGHAVIRKTCKDGEESVDDHTTDSPSVIIRSTPPLDSTVAGTATSCEARFVSTQISLNDKCPGPPQQRVTDTQTCESMAMDSLERIQTHPERGSPYDDHWRSKMAQHDAFNAMHGSADIRKQEKAIPSINEALAACAVEHATNDCVELPAIQERFAAEQKMDGLDVDICDKMALDYIM